MRGKVARVVSTRDSTADGAVCKRARLSGAAISWRADQSRTLPSSRFSTIRSAWRALIAMLLGVSLAACATTGAPTSYMGIELTSPAPASSDAAELQSLARRAQAGDKHAQLELGIRFEEGNGVEQDLKRAKRLYQRASEDDLADVEFYQPAVGDIPAQSLRMKGGPLGNGLAEARRRLCHLNGKTNRGPTNRHCEERGGG